MQEVSRCICGEFLDDVEMKLEVNDNDFDVKVGQGLWWTMNKQLLTTENNKTDRSFVPVQ